MEQLRLRRVNRGPGIALLDTLLILGLLWCGTRTRARTGCLASLGIVPLADNERLGQEVYRHDTDEHEGISSK